MKKKLFLAGSLAALLALTTACSSGNNTETKDASGEQAEAETIYVATWANPKPFTFVNESGELTGYDIEVVRAIDELLPQYEVQFEKTEFPSILAGLDSGRYQVGANNLTSNEERKAKYLFSEPIFNNQYGIVVKSGRDDIKTLKDLGGKKAIVSPGTNYANAVETYNKNNPDNQIEISYSEQDLAKIYQDIESGLYDFTFDQIALFNQYQKEFGFDQQFIPLSDEESSEIGVPFSYLFFSKGEEGEKIQADFNEAIAQLKEDGTLSKISQQFFDGDYSAK
jgi:polar amino acid transport system substrate-binding protein